MKSNLILIAIILLSLLFGCNKNESPTNEQTLKDIDGNIYKTVTIGTQVWMAENLRTTRFNDGTAIPLVTNNHVWKELTTPAYCWYNNDSTSNKNNHGTLYNWFSVNTGKLSPNGWHVPSDEEWHILMSYLHPAKKETITLQEKGIIERPMLHRKGNGIFSPINHYGYLWSSTEKDSIRVSWWDLDTQPGYISSYNGPAKRNGYYVRCIKDN